MELKSIFKMVKTNRYTQDGRDELAKLQAEEVEDVTYKTGDISQKTGLQKQPDGSWAPPKNAGKNVHGAEIDKIYEKHQKRIKELKAKGYTDEQIENDKIYQQTKEDMRNVGKSKPAGSKPDSRALLSHKDHTDLAKEVKSNTMPGSDWTAEEIAKEWKLTKGDAEEVKKEFDKIKESTPAESKPVDKEKLLDTLSFDLVDTTADIEEEYNAVEHSDNSRLPEFVRQEIERDYVNKTNGEKWTDEEKDIIAEEVTRRIKQRQSKDSAPRELTGDTKIRIRK